MKNKNIFLCLIFFILFFIIKCKQSSYNSIVSSNNKKNSSSHSTDSISDNSIEAQTFAMLKQGILNKKYVYTDSIRKGNNLIHIVTHFVMDTFYNETNQLCTYPYITKEEMLFYVDNKLVEQYDLFSPKETVILGNGQKKQVNIYETTLLLLSSPCKNNKWYWELYRGINGSSSKCVFSNQGELLYLNLEEEDVGVKKQYMKDKRYKKVAQVLWESILNKLQPTKTDTVKSYNYWSDTSVYEIETWYSFETVEKLYSARIVFNKLRGCN
jgi:hypothetical protein